jgi:hypothetical protein
MIGIILYGLLVYELTPSPSLKREGRRGFDQVKNQGNTQGTVKTREITL